MSFIRSLFPFLYITGFFAFSQQEASVWYFGQNAGLKFLEDGTVIPLGDGQLNTNEGCSTIADVDGNLLFYTDGRTVWDRNHIIMPNGNYAAGTGLFGDPSSTASALIVPKPGSSNIYYVFTVDEPHHENAAVYPSAFSGDYDDPDSGSVPNHDDGLNNGFNYSVVDLSVTGSNGSIGDVISGNNHLYTYALGGEEDKYKCSEKITAVKDETTDSYWVITQFVDRFYSFNVSTAGVNEAPVVSFVAPVVPIAGYRRNGIGYLKSSPDGEKLALAHNQMTPYPGNDPYKGSFFLYDFDSATGVVSNPLNLLSNVTAYGVEFSADSKKLYVSCREFGPGMTISADRLSQFDMESPDIAASRTVLFASNYGTGVGALQLAPNSKIYYSTSLPGSLGVIQSPEVLGVGCNFDPVGQPLAAGTSRKLGLPPFITSFFDATFTVNDLCLGSSTSFQISNSQNVTSATWDFGDGNTYSGLNPTHTYANPGTYEVTLTAVSSTGTSTKSKNVTIYAVPSANAVASPTICGQQNMTYDLSQHNAEVLGTQLPADFDVAYFASQADADTNTSPLPQMTTLALGVNTFYVRIFNSGNPNCYDLTDFTVSLFVQPTANATTPYVICEESPYDQTEQFDLSTKVGEVLGTQSSTLLVSFHSTQNGADTNTMILSANYTNSLPSETLFVRVTNPDFSGCFATTTLQVSVVPAPRLVAVAPFFECDDNNDGQELFYLATKLNEILDGQASSMFGVKFYQNLADAQANSNEYAGPVIPGIDSQEVFFSIATVANPSCRKVGSFILRVSGTPVINTISDLYLCDDVSNDGFGIFDLQSKNAEIFGGQNASDFSISYHLTSQDAFDGNNPLALQYPNITNPQTVYVRVENSSNNQCFSQSSFQIGLNKMPVAVMPPNLFACDEQNDGSELFDLTAQNALILGSQSAAEFDVSYHRSYQEAVSGINALGANYTSSLPVLTIFAKVSNKINVSCHDIVSFDLIMVAEPEIDLEDIYYLCPGGQLSLSVAPTGNTTYLWSTGVTNSSVTIDQIGNYSVTVTYDYGDITCQKTKTFQVLASGPPTITNIIVKDWTQEQNSITIIAEGDGVYEYSLDGVHYQDSNVFTNLGAGEYTVYVNDQRDCGFITAEVVIMTYPRFFTPNGDGINDYWQVNFSQAEPNMELLIFDRYGKLVSKFRGADLGWDGNLNGSALPSTDYWFVIRRESGKLYRGHFSLKR